MTKTQKDGENYISPMTFKEPQTVIKNIPTKNTAGPDAFIRKLYQIFKEEMRGKKRTFSNSFMRLTLP